jgi:hypothetical protein
MGNSHSSGTIDKISWAPAKVHADEALSEWPIVDFNEIGLVTELSQTSRILGIILPSTVTSAAQVVLSEPDGRPNLWIHPREESGVGLCRRAPVGETLILMSNLRRREYVKSGGTNLVGARLSIRERRDGVIFTSFICPVEIWTSNPRIVAIWSTGPKDGRSKLCAVYRCSCGGVDATGVWYVLSIPFEFSIGARVTFNMNNGRQTRVTGPSLRDTGKTERTS